MPATGPGHPHAPDATPQEAAEPAFTVCRTGRPCPAAAAKRPSGAAFPVTGF